MLHYRRRVVTFLSVLLNRWSSRRRAVGALAVSGLSVTFVLLLGLVIDEMRIAAAISLVVLIVGVGYTASLAVRGFVRRAQLDGYGAGPWLVATPISLTRVPAEHHEFVVTPTARRATALESLQSEQWVASRSFEVAAHARSFAGSELLASLATGRRWGLDALIAIASSASSASAINDAVGPVAGEPGSTLARWLLASSDPVRRTAGAVLARLVIDQGADRGTGEATRLRLVHGLILAGEHDAARGWLEGLDPQHPEVRLLALDLARADDDLSRQGWNAALGARFERAGIEPVHVDFEATTPFDGLHADAPTLSHDRDDPLITVVMSCFEPDDSILSAVRSIVAQTWTRWELLVMDDASNEADQVLAAVADLDSRIRVIKAERNSGTYVRRNEAMLLARGSLFTAHDSDDWAHPRRLEIQARHLMANPVLLANVSESLRVGTDMRFAQPRASGLRLTEATIMFHRSAVMEQIGFYDSVRRAADSEFRLRLESVTSKLVPIVRVGAPLTLVRSRFDSLSGSDFADQWIHPARVAYRSAMSHWLREQLDAGRAGRIDHPQTIRVFPAHAHLTGAEPTDDEFDVVIVGDTRDSGQFANDEIPQLIREAVEQGLRVGVRRLEDIGRGRSRAGTAQPVQALISSGAVVELLSTDAAETRLLVVAGNRCLLGLGERDQGVRSTKVHVISEATASLRPFLDDILTTLVGHEAAASASTVGWKAAVPRLP